jgi:hypothetical protein
MRKTALRLTEMATELAMLWAMVSSVVELALRHLLNETF